MVFWYFCVSIYRLVFYFLNFTADFVFQFKINLYLKSSNIRYVFKVQFKNYLIYIFVGCSNPVFALFREKDVCLKTFSTTNRTFSYASTACEQEASELTILNTTETVDALAHYLFYTCKYNLKRSEVDHNLRFFHVLEILSCSKITCNPKS